MPRYHRKRQRLAEWKERRSLTPWRRQRNALQSSVHCLLVSSKPKEGSVKLLSRFVGAFSASIIYVSFCFSCEFLFYFLIHFHVFSLMDQFFCAWYPRVGNSKRVQWSCPHRGKILVLFTLIVLNIDSKMRQTAVFFIQLKTKIGEATYRPVWLYLVLAQKRCQCCSFLID